ncbi:MFS transporter, acetyl-coa transporter [Rhizoctonia solani]|uniref:MFS transporter, acetyl-coa transporter n=1 Tax=Rhizoctonia solani TaxID=456999 RepID=A0A8H8NV88_9AGAM|nr:MFS transporter, acetyl-coa transporter [Rhizoctonia solani]QRW19026.1 MFS transporter, acetyl-coa transporter [Rhizoctonia solani]
MPSQKTGSVRKRNKPRPSPSPSPAPTTDMEVLSSPSTTKARASRANGRKSDKVGDEEVSMSLLGESERQAAAEGLEPEPEHHDEEKRLKAPMSSKDKAAMALLITLYLIQGIPIGLAFGSIPFLLKSKLSYSQLGAFSLATYPYSLKLFWSPIVDSVFSPTIGRRKSWIVPMQFIIGSLMLWMSSHVQSLIDVPEPDVNQLTTIFTSLVFLAATQDIAVDGWALTLLSKENLSYASTAQTIGLNTGYFLSFTVFLAFNSADFANKYFRSVPSEIPLLSLGAYLQFWGFACYAVTLGLLIFKKEDPVAADDPDLNLKKVYEIMWSICKLKHVQSICIIHLVAKIGFQANDAVTSLKLVEKGLSKEDLALAVLIDFPAQIIGGWICRWRYGTRLFLPKHQPVPSSYFWGIVAFTVLGSFSSTVQFVGVSAFHTQISDPLIGGTYMTLLNTVSNLGGTWPRYFVLKGVDMFSEATCHVEQEGSEILMKATECVSEHGKATCTDLGGTCVTERDGYYIVSWICIGLGASILVFYIWPTAKRLQALKRSQWRTHIVTSGAKPSRRVPFGIPSHAVPARACPLFPAGVLC